MKNKKYIWVFLNLTDAHKILVNVPKQPSDEIQYTCIFTIRKSYRQSLAFYWLKQLADICIFKSTVSKKSNSVCFINDPHVIKINNLKKEIWKDVKTVMLPSIICYLPTIEIKRNNHVMRLIQWRCDILVRGNLVFYRSSTK